MEDATALSQRIARWELSCVELMRACLERIEAVNPALNAIVSLRDGDELLAEAAERDAELARGEYRGWMHGLPHAIKDLEDTAGIVTTSGSPLFADFVPAADSEVVRRIREAGAVMLGKTNVPELEIVPFTETPTWGITRNPWDLQRTSGGSSGGSSTAVAAGLCSAALGSDGGGSIRIPAAACGLFGLKPQRGRVPTSPVVEPWNGMSTWGVISRRTYSRIAGLGASTAAASMRSDGGWKSASWKSRASPVGVTAQALSASEPRRKSHLMPADCSPQAAMTIVSKCSRSFAIRSASRGRSSEKASRSSAREQSEAQWKP